MAEEKRKGKIHAQWKFPEYEKPERGPGWYATAIIFGGGLLAYALWDGNFLFAIMILLVAFIVFTHHRRDPLDVMFTVFDFGLQIGDKYYDYRDIATFAVVYDPPVVKTLYIKPKNGLFQSEISIPLGRQNPLKIRKVLLDYIDEDLTKEKATPADEIARLLRL